MSELISQLLDRTKGSLPGSEGSREQFAKIGMPSKRNEEYKYSALGRKLKELGKSSELDNSVLNPSEILPSELTQNMAVFVNGKFDSDVSTSKNISFFEAISTKGKIEHTLSPAFNTEPFVQLNRGLSTDGAYINIPSGTTVNEPVVIVNISTSADLTNVTHVVKVGENAELNIIEINISSGSSFSNNVMHIELEQGSRVDFCKIAHDHENACHVGTTDVLQGQKSNFTSTVINLDGAVIRNNLRIRMDGEHSEAHMNGLYLLVGNSQVDNNTVVDHLSPNCYSNELYKGVLDGQSTGIFNGRIYVHKDAQKTNAFQSNKNILMSNDATINTKPQLEIWADDVKCSHGCTTGRLDNEQLFYLRARGISKDSARAILLNAFAGEVVNKIKNESLRKWVEDQIEKRLLS